MKVKRFFYAIKIRKNNSITTPRERGVMKTPLEFFFNTGESIICKNICEHSRDLLDSKRTLSSYYLEKLLATSGIVTRKKLSKARTRWRIEIVSSIIRIGLATGYGDPRYGRPPGVLCPGAVAGGAAPRVGGLVAVRPSPVRLEVEQKEKKMEKWKKNKNQSINQSINRWICSFVDSKLEFLFFCSS